MADLVENLPPGCALWRATGGPMSWTQDMHLLAAVKHGLDVLAWQNAHGKKSDYPKLIPYPEYEGEGRAKEAVMDKKRARRMARIEQQEPRAE